LNTYTISLTSSNFKKCKTIIITRTELFIKINHLYRAAKKREWNINDLPWDSLPLIPHFESEKWHLLWSSIVQQQLQADLFAVKAASHLLNIVENNEAKLYYSTMVTDETRHVEGWQRLANGLNYADGNSPYFDELQEMFWEANSIEELVLVFQVCYEGCAIDAFKEISNSTSNTVLGAMSEKLIGDDIIHHQSGIAYSEYMLSKASPSFKKHLEQQLKKYMPLYIQNLSWRSPNRKWVTKFMKTRDQHIIKRNKFQLNKAVSDLGLAAPFEI